MKAEVKEMQDLSSTIILTLTYLFLVLAIPVGAVFGLTYINRNTKQLLVSYFGERSQIYCGGLGIIIHELSHFLIALLFGHQITSFKFLIMPWNLNEEDGSLGYVNHSWDDNSLYQNVGNVFIGTAPIWGCTGALILTTKYFANSLYQSFTSAIESYGTISSLKLIVLQLFTHLTLGPLTFQNIIMLLIWGILSVNITVGGFDLSNADLKGSFSSFILTYAILTVILFILVYCGFSMLISYWLYRGCAWFSLIMLISFLWSLFSNLILRLILFIQEKFGSEDI